MISVSGIRGHVGTDLTPELVARYAAALGAWSRRAKSDRAIVILGRDARTSGSMYARAATAGLMSVGVDVIDLGIVPTPSF
jgi:phosphomannomutase